MDYEQIGLVPLPAARGGGVHRPFAWPHSGATPGGVGGSVLFGGLLLPLAFQLDSILNVRGPVTVVGVLLVIVVALYLGLLSPRHTVQDLKTRLSEREEENAALHAERIKDIEEKAELRGEVSALRNEVATLRQEVTALRQEAERMRRSREE